MILLVWIFVLVGRRLCSLRSGRHGWISAAAEVCIVQVDIALKTLRAVAIALAGNQAANLRFHDIQSEGLFADQVVDVVGAVGLGDHVGDCAGLQIHDCTMVRRQGGAAHLLHFCTRGISRLSSRGVGLFLQFVGVLTLNGTSAEIMCHLSHCFFSSFLLCRGRGLARTGVYSCTCACTCLRTGLWRYR